MIEPEIVLNFAGPQKPWDNLFELYGHMVDRPHTFNPQRHVWAFKPEVHEWFADMGFEYQLRYEKFHIAERIVMLSEPDAFMAFKLRWT